MLISVHPRPYTVYISYAYGTICAESAVKHQTNKQTFINDFLSYPANRQTDRQINGG